MKSHEQSQIFPRFFPVKVLLSNHLGPWGPVAISPPGLTAADEDEDSKATEDAAAFLFHGHHGGSEHHATIKGYPPMTKETSRWDVREFLYVSIS